jgi:hypothetical protein
MKLSSLAFVLSLTLLASCGGGGGGGSKSSKSSSKVVSGKEYYSNCRYNVDSEIYIKSIVRVENEETEPKITFIDEYYNDSACAKVKLNAEFPMDKITVSGERAYDGEMREIHYRPRSKEIVKEMNNKYLCGRNWQLNVAQDVTGTSCEEEAMDAKVTVQMTDILAMVKVCPNDGSKCEKFLLYKL